MTAENESMRNYILSVMVNNHFGVLTRISGLHGAAITSKALPSVRRRTSASRG